MTNADLFFVDQPLQVIIIELAGIERAAAIEPDLVDAVQRREMLPVKAVIQLLPGRFRRKIIKVLVSADVEQEGVVHLFHLPVPILYGNGIGFVRQLPDGPGKLAEGSRRSSFKGDDIAFVRRLPATRQPGIEGEVFGREQRMQGVKASAEAHGEQEQCSYNDRSFHRLNFIQQNYPAL